MLYSYLTPVLILITLKEVTGVFNKNPNFDRNTWTSCQEFVKHKEFNKSSVININWKIFYFWDHHYETSFGMKFSEPSDEVVNRFKSWLDMKLDHPANWTDADLYMETTIKINALLLKTNVSGIFRAIPNTALKYSNLQAMWFGMKVEDGYLGIAHCDHRKCYALAPEDKMPAADQVIASAAKIGFKSPAGRSHLTAPSEHDRAFMAYHHPRYRKGEFDDYDILPFDTDILENDDDEHFNKTKELL